MAGTDISASYFHAEILQNNNRRLGTRDTRDSISAPASASCGSAYCSLNTDLAAEAAGIVEGSTFDLRYE